MEAGHSQEGTGTVTWRDGELAMSEEASRSNHNWFGFYAYEHDRIAAFIREHFPGEPDCGKPTQEESPFDVALRLLARYAADHR